MEVIYMGEKQKGRLDEIDKAISEGYKEVINRNWNDIREHLDELEGKDDEGYCLILTLNIDDEGFHIEIAGLDKADEYEGSPDNFCDIFIEVDFETTKRKLSAFPIADKSEYWNVKWFMEDVNNLLVEEEEVCPDCDSIVSSDASKCPKCGCVFDLD